MERHARLQTLTLVLLGAFAWLCLDIAAIPDAVTDYLQEALDEAPVEPPREPTLIGRGDRDAAARDETAAGGGGGSGRKPTIIVDGALPSRIVGPAQEEPVLIPTIVVDSTPPLRNLDMAARLLGLGMRQTEELRRLLEDARRDLDDLRHAVNEDGETWYALAERLGALQEGGDLRALLDATAELQAFARTILRGSNETYEAARRRVLASHSEVVRAHLTPEQQARWDRFDPQALLDRRPAPLRSLQVKTARHVWTIHPQARG